MISFKAEDTVAYHDMNDDMKVSRQEHGLSHCVRMFPSRMMLDTLSTYIWRSCGIRWCSGTLFGLDA